MSPQKIGRSAAGYRPTLGRTKSCKVSGRGQTPGANYRLWLVALRWEGDAVAAPIGTQSVEATPSEMSD
jgi:hypothetical protein